ncbi:hypothetical protein KIPB_007115 [Kipferlia bialata]|uniref:Uncharacterized protein n=1 Tax=Kipferlia bialata TaxID=797122 RepID=A0A9K3CY37_9EUKA|nr:hypothetical protein KIPB_007115 [Kipferlia bialata]|eukprot:g7115.t1
MWEWTPPAAEGRQGLAVPLLANLRSDPTHPETERALTVSECYRRVPAGTGSKLLTLDWNKRGNLLAVAGTSKTVYMYSVSEKEREKGAASQSVKVTSLSPLHQTDSVISQVAFSPNALGVLAGGQSGAVSLFSISQMGTFRRRTQGTGHKNSVSCAAFSSPPSSLSTSAPLPSSLSAESEAFHVTCGMDGLVHVYRTPSPQQKERDVGKPHWTFDLKSRPSWDTPGVPVLPRSVFVCKFLPISGAASGGPGFRRPAPPRDEGERDVLIALGCSHGHLVVLNATRRVVVYDECVHGAEPVFALAATVSLSTRQRAAGDTESPETPLLASGGGDGTVCVHTWAKGEVSQLHKMDAVALHSAATPDPEVPRLSKIGAAVFSLCFDPFSSAAALGTSRLEHLVDASDTLAIGTRSGHVLLVDVAVQ